MMKEILNSKERIALFIVTMIAIFFAVAFISVIVNTNKNLDKIIYNAKKEAENTLISTGRAIYAEDVENSVGELSGRPLNAINLPENTNENPQLEGTIVKPKAGWNIETVTAVSVGGGDTVPIPKGFYYVGGDLSTGVIISDDQSDEYDGQTDKTTWEYTTNLKGNQFVWIPCGEEEYKKCEVWNGIKQQTSGTNNSGGTLSSKGGWDKTTYASELPQIRKYGGYYVGRYEAGLASSITEFTSEQQNTGSNQVYNKEGIPQSKAGVVPWNFIDWEKAQKNTKNMYNTESVSSGLITGTQWDVMLNKMVEKGAIKENDLTNSGNWGNYKDNSIEYTGRMARSRLSSGGWYLAAFGGKATSKTTSYSSDSNGDFLTTGASSSTEAYHIYDVAGNLWELTDECSLYKVNTANETNIQYHVIRGGCGIDAFGSSPACWRYCGAMLTYSSFNLGLRIVLYVK